MSQANDRDLLRLIGGALYGEHWQTALAQEIGVADRTVRRWLSGADQPRPGVWGDILQVAERRRGDINDAIEKLRRRAVSG